MKPSLASFGALALSGTLALGAVLLGAPNPASATVYRALNGGVACKPAFSGSDKFIFNNLYAENVGTTDQYLVCHLVMDDASVTPPAPQNLDVWFTAGATGGTAVCLVQTGYYAGGPVLRANVAGSVTLAAGVTSYVSWNESLLLRSTYLYAVTLNCKVPGSWRLGLMDYQTAS